MLRSRTMLLAIASLTLFACNDDYPSVTPVTSDTPVVHPQHAGAMAIAHGGAIAVQPSMIHPEIEGASSLPVTGVRADDALILDVRPASQSYSVRNSFSPNGRTWILVGVAPGSTTLRLYRDGDEVGTMAVDVIGQAP